MVNETMLVTGATGMIGAFVAQRAVREGYRVRALVRAGSDRRELKALGVELVDGDLAAPETLPSALKGIDVVVHSAAHIGDWGPAEKYRAINVVALEHLLSAAQREGRLRRWIHVSTLGVYPARDHFGTDETTPPDLAGLDGYTRTKAEAEVLLKRRIEEDKFPAVILRPGFVYGPGERHVIPRLLEKFEAGQMKFIGDGKKLLNNTFVGNFVDAVFLALQKDEALGETFNIRDGRLVSRLEYINTVADYLDKPHPKHVPLWLAKAAAPVIEGFARWTGRQEAPLLTGARIKFMTLNLDFSIAKARRFLGYQPHVDFQEGIKEALDAAVRPGSVRKSLQSCSSGATLDAESVPGA